MHKKSLLVNVRLNLDLLIVAKFDILSKSPGRCFLAYERYPKSN